MTDERRVEVAEQSARAGATVAEELFRTALTVEKKSGKTDVVTKADRRAQEAILDTIRTTFPDAAVVAEENDAAGAVPTEGMTWLVDPIDGTQNFVRGSRHWTTSVTCLEDGEPVAVANYVPAMGDRYVGTPDGVVRNGDPVSVSTRTDTDLFTVVPTIWWDLDRRDEYAAATTAVVERFGDLRRIGSAQAALSMLAAGVYDGVLTNIETEPWDTVGGAALVRWAGGTVTDLAGDDWDHDSRGLVASNGRAHETVQAAARAIETETTKR